MGSSGRGKGGEADGGSGRDGRGGWESVRCRDGMVRSADVPGRSVHEAAAVFHGVAGHLQVAGVGKLRRRDAQLEVDLARVVPTVSWPKTTVNVKRVPLSFVSVQICPWRKVAVVPMLSSFQVQPPAR